MGEAIKLMPILKISSYFYYVSTFKMSINIFNLNVISYLLIWLHYFIFVHIVASFLVLEGP